MKKVIKFLANFVSVVVIVVSLYMLLTVVLTRSGEAPNIFGYSAFRVLTGSMEPEIPQDSLVVTKKVDPSQIQPDDVISYYSTDPELKGAVNTHRVISVEQDGGSYQYTTRGDANALADEYPATEDKLVGKVVFVSYPLGVAVNFLSSPLGFVALIIIPLAVILIGGVYRTISSARKIMKEEEEDAVRQAMEEIRKKKR